MMNNTMEYRGYVGSVEFSEEDGIFYGKVMGIRALISYEGTTAKELVEDFHTAVDDYLALCENKGVKPEIAYKGSFNVRMSYTRQHTKCRSTASWKTRSGLRCPHIDKQKRRRSDRCCSAVRRFALLDIL